MEHFFILGIIVIALALFAWEIIRPDLVAIGVMLVLIVSGTVTVSEGFSGFSNPAVITVIAMFILSSGLVRTGVADFLAQGVYKIGGNHPVSLTISVMLCVGVMSAFMNNIGAVAVLLPTMFVIAQKAGYPPGKLLMPLAFGSLLGGLTTLIGTPPNLLASIILEEHGFAPFKLFDFAPTGLAVMVTGMLFMAFIGRHLIPVRKEEEADFTHRYKLRDYLTEVEIHPESPLVGLSLGETSVFRDLGLTALRVKRKRKNRIVSILPTPRLVFEDGDRLIVEGDLGELLRIKEGAPMKIRAEKRLTEEELKNPDLQIAEMVVAPNSRLIGRSIKEIDVRQRFGVLVLAMKRRSLAINKNFAAIPIESADVLLVQGTSEAIKRIQEGREFLIVRNLEEQPRLHHKAPVALAIMAAAIIIAATGLAHISVAGMAAVILMAVTGCVKVQELYQAVEWKVIFLIAGMMPLGIAMDDKHTGTATWMAGLMLEQTSSWGPLACMACLYVLTMGITQIMSNAAATVLIAPVAIAVALGLDASPYPFVMAVAIAASSSFITPIGHQANVLVYTAGNYRFADFLKVGGPLSILLFIVSMIVIPMVWPFAAVPR
ncbi:SLC13 family permease [Oscillatoria amoena NRMC-F 0135]|nr:SLC13 family permease [Oscillatoria laete-virens]MDL5048382.1 SLC13 family permease [Oscillatoria amoena NRMC-F 0135]MDL5054253.1 SLC13 family permease [Oscillatoria laete-virens NRMC-F 0139]